MHHQKQVLLKNLTSLHHFNLGSYVPIHDTKNRQLIQCLLCGQQRNSKAILSHIYNFRQSSQFLWRNIGFHARKYVREMLAPVETSSSSVLEISRLVKVAHRVYFRRPRKVIQVVETAPLLDKQLSRVLGQTTPLGR